MRPLPYTSASCVKERLPAGPLNIFLQAVASVDHAPVISMASARNPGMSDPIRMTTRMAIERKFNVDFLISRGAINMRQHALNRSRGDKDWQNIAKVHGRPILRNGRVCPLNF